MARSEAHLGRQSHRKCRQSSTLISCVSGCNETKVKLSILVLVVLICTTLMIRYDHRMGILLRMPVLAVMMTAFFFAFKDLSDRFPAVRTPRLRNLIWIMIGLALCPILVYVIAMLIR